MLKPIKNAFISDPTRTGLLLFLFVFWIQKVLNLAMVTYQSELFFTLLSEAWILFMAIFGFIFISIVFQFTRGK
jgi:hypothetical protein